MNNQFSPSDEKSLTNIDLVGLLHWYHEEVQKHKKAFKGTLQALYASIMFPVLAFFSFTVAILNGNTRLFLLYALLIPSAIMMFYFFQNKNKRIYNIIKGNRYFELNENQFPKIWEASYNILRRMNLSHTLKIYYVKKEKAQASVVLEENTIYLLLSRGMISYSQVNFKDVESIIGHELGHVCQGDSKLLLIGKSTIQIPAVLMVLSWILLRLDVFKELQGFFRFQADLGVGFLLPLGLLFFIVQRRKAEYLADMASVIFVDNSSISKILANNVSGFGNLSYPSGKRRIGFIRKIVSQYNKVNQPLPAMLKQS